MKLAAAGLLLTGCFYIDPINRRPSVEIHQISTGAIRRGGSVMFDPGFTDPDGKAGTFAWRVYACGNESDAHRGMGCDAEAFDTSTEANFTVAKVSTHKADGAPVGAIRVALEARDDLGALSTGNQVYGVVDGLPTLELRKSARRYVLDAPIDVFAKYGDPDDSPDQLALVWKVYTPSTQPTYSWTELELGQSADDPEHRTAGWRLVPHGIGDWEVQVTARDPLGEMVEEHVSFTVQPDRPPCLAQWQPIAPPPGASLPLTAPTVFQIPLVDDDLDVYPPVPGDPVLGIASFAWSILPPGASVRQPLVGATGNSVDLDPRAFTPGDLVELRVEVFDRAHTAVGCADDLPTCPVVSRPDCTQRLTWQLEIR